MYFLILELLDPSGGRRVHSFLLILFYDVVQRGRRKSDRQRKREIQINGVREKKETRKRMIKVGLLLMRPEGER